MRKQTQPHSTNAPSVDSRGNINWGKPTKDLPKVGVLLLEDYQRRAGGKRKAWNDRRYLGLNIVLDVVRRAYGIEADYTSIKTINNYDIVLISLTSTVDVYNLIYTFEKYDLKITRPKIVIGGAGVLNIKPYYTYGDYFVFGRGEVPIIDLMEHFINNAPIDNDSIFIKGESTFDESFTLAQVDNPYPFEVSGLKESPVGCPLKCFYCGYTYHRKPQKGRYFYLDDEFWNASEMTIREVVREIKDGSRVVTSIDGSSERLRAAMNKKMSDDEYRDVIASIPKVKADSVFLKVFNICGYPTETASERLEPFTVLLPVADKLANSTTILYQMNPFIPMALTPAQYLPADIFQDFRAWYHQFRAQNGGGWIVEKGRLRVGVGTSINTNLGLLKRCLIHRGREGDLNLLRNIIFNRRLTKLRASEQVKALLTLPDMEWFYRRYEPGEAMPFDYLQSYSSKKAIDNLARRLHQDLGL